MPPIVYVGKVTVTVSLALTETLPTASFAQAYRVLEPADANVYVAGAEPDQPEASQAGAVELSVNL